ncbi:hypothetical protein D3C80_553060 [compost metagenome]
MAPLAQRLGKLADVVGAEGGLAEGELAGGTVRQNLDRIDLAKLGQRSRNRRQTILTGLNYQHLNVARQVCGELLTAFDATVEHQQVPGGRGLLAGFAAGIGGGGVRGVGIGAVAVVLMLLICRSGGSTVKQDARFQRQRLALGFECGRHSRTGLGRHVHIITLSPWRGRTVIVLAMQIPAPGTCPWVG